MNCLRSLERWDRGFESRWKHGCLYVRLFCVRVVLCIGRGLATGWSLVQGFLPSVKKRLRNWRRGQGPTKGHWWMNVVILARLLQGLFYEELQLLVISRTGWYRLSKFRKIVQFTYSRWIVPEDDNLNIWRSFEKFQYFTRIIPERRNYTYC
jgi:hypothetical protein